jgi:hypothetical protein
MCPPSGPVVQPNFGATLAAQISQVEMPANWNAPREFPMPVVGPVSAPVQRSAPLENGVGMMGLGSIVANVGLGMNLLAAIPQVQLPAGWDAPLANPVPVVPPAPQLLHRRRRRGRGRVTGPLHDISGGQADPALNGLHRGHIALRERGNDYNMHVEQLQHQGEAARQHERALLQRVGEERRMAKAAAARDRRIQLPAEQETQRQADEEIAARREAEAVAAREIMLERQAEDDRIRQAEAATARKRRLEQLAEEEKRRQAAEAEAARQNNLQLSQQVIQQQVERQAAVQQAALAVEPLYHDLPRHIDIQAALQERNQREQEWIQRVHAMWRNERLAEDQVQLDELEELQRISIEERNLQQRIIQLDQLGNNMSRDQIDEYHAQVAAQEEQIQTDREMAAALAAEYEYQCNNEIALRRKIELDEEESDDEEYDEFGKVSPLRFPSSLPSSPMQAQLPLPSASLLCPPSLQRKPTPEFDLPPPPPLAAPARPLPPACAPYQEPLQRHSLGPMDVECQHCHALHFDCEKLTKSTRAVSKFGSCCLEGQIRLPPFPQAPAALRDLLCGRSPLAKEFKANIQQYNATFGFTSLGVNVDHTVTHATGPYSFCIQGDLHHLSGALMPPPGQHAVFAQLYIHDPLAQLRLREGSNTNLNSVIMTQLQAMLNDTHPYVPLYKQAFQIMREKPPEEQQNVTIRLRADRNQDMCRYNLPTASDEVAAIIPGDGSEEQSDHRDIVIRLQGGGLKRISQLHPSYSSLHYVLLFPHGEDGWHLDIPAHQTANGTRRAPNVSQVAIILIDYIQGQENSHHCCGVGIYCSSML